MIFVLILRKVCFGQEFKCFFFFKLFFFCSVFVHQVQVTNTNMAYERDLDVMELFLDDDCDMYQSVAPGEDIWKNFGLPLTPPLSPSATFFPTDSVLDLLDPSPSHLDNVLSDVILQDCMWSGFVDRKRAFSGEGPSGGAQVERPRLPVYEGVESPSRRSCEPMIRSLDLGEVLGLSSPALDQDKPSVKVQIKVEELPSPTRGMETPSDSEDDQHGEDTEDDDEDDEEDDDDDDDDDEDEEADDEDEEVEIDVVSVEKVPAFSLHQLSFGQNTNTAARYGMQRGLGSCAAIKRHQIPVHQQHNYAASPPSPPPPPLPSPPQKAPATKRSRIDPPLPTDCLLYGNFSVAPLSPSFNCNEDLTKRKTHNILERQRRDSLKRRFTDLRVNVPSVANKERAAKVLILKAATDYTQVLREKENNLEDEKLRLLERRRELVRRLHHLRSV
uniref:protein L-Myc-1-A-like isoform X1 n=2 Tax=Myxine glutinosa TaxID=7769 RepID=UPI00358EDFCF